MRALSGKRLVSALAKLGFNASEAAGHDHNAYPSSGNVLLILEVPVAGKEYFEACLEGAFQQLSV